MPGGRGDAPTPAVEVVQARYGALPLEARFSGTVRAENQVILFPEISASIIRVAAENGDFVRDGQPLVYLRDTQFREQLQQSEAALRISQAEAQRTQALLNEAQTRLERTEELAARQFQSTQELEAIKAEVAAAEANHEEALGRIAQAEANIEEARESLRRTILRAPISGFVGQRNAEIGMRVDPNTRLFTIGNLEVVKVDFAVNDEMISKIQQGQTALISAPGLDRTIRAEVSRISPFLEEGSFSAGAQIDVPNHEGLLRPGMFVTVDVLYGESQQATLVPTSALYDNPESGATGIYVATSLGTEFPVEPVDEFDPNDPPPLLEATPLTFHEITILARGREMVGIQGAQPGDWIVTVGQNLLSNQQEERPQARVRTIPWDRVASLQRLQDQDLLRDFMEKQQRLARNDSPGTELGLLDSSRVVQSTSNLQ